MQKSLLIATTCAAILALQACSATKTRVESAAVRDYIAAAELEQTDQIRVRALQSPTHNPINEQFVILDAGSGQHLLEFRQRCYALYDNSRITPDVRREGNVLRARFDTLRGCPIDKIYKIDAEQAKELRELGDAPGDEADLD